ncbi:ATP-binding protein [Streptomyces sp. NPDC058664]|uniref:ATP-binding protein n=1 Tax=unclassified Streptomyces TaxID=2593676 RepID=UPI00364B08BF
MRSEESGPTRSGGPPRRAGSATATATGAQVGAQRGSLAASRDPRGAGGTNGSTPFECHVRTEEDLLRARHAVRAATQELGFSLVDQTRIVTAASELARNAFVHGGGGVLSIERLRRAGATGLCLTVRDEGPGIADLEGALTDGFTTGGGLGHGLGGARRLMHEFEVRSAPGQGTTVIAVRWSDR